MKNYLAIFLIITLLSCKGSSSTPVNPAGKLVTTSSLIGKWEHMEAYANPAWHSYYEFKSDNTVALTYVVSSGSGSDGVYPYTIEDNLLRIRYESTMGFAIPKDKECETIVLPATLSSKLTCKSLGKNYCVYTYKGTEKYADFTLVKQ